MLKWCLHYGVNRSKLKLSVNQTLSCVYTVAIIDKALGLFKMQKCIFVL
jgi:hypothetical protein